MIESMKQALEALEEVQEFMNTSDWFNDKVTSLRQAIAELESQEPVAWQVHPFDYGIGHKGVYARTDRPEQVELWKRKGWNVQPLHTYPPAAQRTWVGLTDEDRQAAFESMPDMLDGFLKTWGWLHFSKALEAKLKHKNGFTEEKNT
jgi:hypothetical protein